MGRFQDFTGQRFGKWLVLRRQPTNAKKQTVWRCLCDCGTERDVRAQGLAESHSTSCGCVRAITLPASRRTHGQSRHGPWHYLYRLWHNIQKRCYDPKCDKFAYYGGRGISMCPEWKRSFPAFLAYVSETLGQRPLRHSMDRIDNNGNYEPGNVRWATPKEQMANSRAYGGRHFAGRV